MKKVQVHTMIGDRFLLITVLRGAPHVSPSLSPLAKTPRVKSSLQSGSEWNTNRSVSSDRHRSGKSPNGRPQVRQVGWRHAIERSIPIVQYSKQVYSKQHSNLHVQHKMNRTDPSTSGRGRKWWHLTLPWRVSSPPTWLYQRVMESGIGCLFI